MATYVDFAYYSTTYGGKAIASTDFTALAKRASAAIDLLTMDRAAAYMAIAVPTPEEAGSGSAACIFFRRWYHCK